MMVFNRRKFLIKHASWMLIVFLLLVWEMICVGLNVPEYLFPAPSSVWASGVDRWQPIMMHAWQTFFTTLVGFAIAVVVGVVLGVAVGTYPIVYKAFYPLLVGFNSIPKVAFVPVLVVWFGIGTVPAILTAFLISFFPVLVNVATGLATLEPELEDVLRSLGASKLDILRKVGLPRALPYFFASLKVAITLAFVGSVISETVASNMGIGYLMMAASSSMDMALVFAGLIVIGIMGVVMYELFAWTEKRFTRWANRGVNNTAI
ncbi:MAG: ABC transporter permease [Marinomonas hwangdonensis]|nr:ABC transporter permease [Marinomonas hwangdonensis]